MSVFDIIDAPPIAPPPVVVPPRQPKPTLRKLMPQPGFQQAVLATPADICIAGSGAGVGKTYGLLLEATRNLDVKNFGAVIFRRETPMITNEGALWDETVKLFGGIAKPNLNELSWAFDPHGCKIRFSHMQLVSDRFNWDGSQIPLIGWDQLEQFHEIQFWYMLSRNRTTCGVIPYIRATANPVPDNDPIGGWLRKLVDWWIDKDTGLYRPDRSGVIRWLARIGDLIHWGDTRDELLASLKVQYPEYPVEDLQPKSFTFIGGKLTDNQELLRRNPEYKGSLLALPKHERDRLLGGNWNSKPEAGKVFNRAWFKVLMAVPADIVKLVRYWDKAGTEGGGKYSAGVLVGKRSNGRTVVLNVQRGQWGSFQRETNIKNTATGDAIAWGGNVDTWLEQEPGSGGKESAENTVLNLAGHTVHVERVTGSKLVRSGPFAAQAEAGNVDVIADLGPSLNGVSALEAFLNEAQNFDGVSGYSDQIDAAGGAFNKLNVEQRSAGVW